MGTTLTAVVVAGGRQLLIGHVGDSRAYLLHDGEMRRITDDHSLVEELVREGRLTPEQAESHPQRAIVTRALGVDADVEVDLYTIEVAAGDRVLLCSDGLTTMVRDRDVERLARSETDPQRAAEVLVDAANRAGGEDNTSVVVIDVLEVDAVTGARSRAARRARPPPPRRWRPRPIPPPPPPPALHASRGAAASAGALLLFLPLVLVLGIAVGGVGWYARRSYYVGFAEQPCRDLQGRARRRARMESDGRPARPGSSTAQLTQIDHDRVAGGAARGSLVGRAAASWPRSRPTSRRPPPRPRPRRTTTATETDHARKPTAAAPTKPDRVR